jgi:serine/threonine protein phosphatase 1
MRLFAVGDIHGCATALEVILAEIDLRPGDKLVSLGDYLNKGPQTCQVLDRLLQLDDQGFLVPLLGNHEINLLAAGRLKQTQIGSTVLVDNHTLNSYGAETSAMGLAAIPDRHWQFIETCRAWYMTDDYIFVHATLQPDRPMAQQSETALFWDKLVYPQPHQSGKTMVCGHTPQRSGHPFNVGHAICLDTAACEGQWLTCLEVFSGEVWQANQQQDLQTAHIDDFFMPLVGGASTAHPDQDAASTAATLVA